MAMRLARAALAVFASFCAACSATGDSPFFDTESPASVIDTVPVDGATGVSTTTSIELDLSGDLDPSSLDDAFLLLPTGGNPETDAVAVNLIYDEERLARFELAAGTELQLSTSYTASVTGARDLRGRPVATYTWDFTTVSPAAPALLSMMPAPGTLAPGNFVIRAVFSVPIDVTRWDATPFDVKADGVLVSGVFTYDAPAQAITFRPNSPADGAIVAIVDPMFDIFGRSVALGSAGTLAFTADVATSDLARPVLGLVTASLSSGSGISVTYDLASDDTWPNGAMRYELLLTRLAPPTPAGCSDTFTPESRRAAVFGSAGTLSIGGLLPGSSWAITLEAEDGSGRRSLSNSSAGNLTIAGGPTFVDVIQPLLSDRCAVACHTGNDPPGYVDYTESLDEIKAHASQYQGMPLITPHCLEESYLWRKLSPGYEIVGQPMPPEEIPASQLSRRERELFRIWIQELGGN